MTTYSLSELNITNLTIQLFAYSGILPVFRNTIRVSNSLDHDQNGRSFGPDLHSNCLQRLLAEDKLHRQLGKLTC